MQNLTWEWGLKRAEALPDFFAFLSGNDILHLSELNILLAALIIIFPT